MAWSVTADPVEFTDAIAWFRKRVAMTRAEYRRATAEAKRKAFFVSNIAQADLVKQAMASLDKALRDGTPFEDFKKGVGAELTKAWRGKVDDPPWRLETIFRNNVQRAYGAGRYKQATHPDVASDRPVWMFDAILDGRETDICQACDGTKLPSDDPWWTGRVPPLHHNCRSSFITLTEEQAGALTKRPTSRLAQDGFGQAPDAGEWEPEVAKYPASIQPTLRKKLAKAPKKPARSLISGVHIGSVSNGPLNAEQVQRMLGSVSDAETLAYLANEPLASLSFRDGLSYNGKSVNGLYWPGGRRIDLRTNRSRRSWGQPWVPGKTFSVESAGGTKEIADKLALRHEIGHHLHLHYGGGPNVDRLIQAAYKRARSSGRFITEYAGDDPNEYFAESYAAYYARRHDLKRYDPNGYAMVEDVLRERGILP